MTKILSVFAVMMVMSTTMFARKVDAPATTSATAVMKNGSTFKLFYKGVKESTVKVTIINGADQIVYKEVLRKVESFMRPYNFSNLPEGEYTIELSDDQGTHTEKVSYEKGIIEKLAHLSRIGSDNSRLMLTVANKDSKSLLVKIFNEEHVLLYSGREETQGDFAKIYNLEKVSGKVLFEITDDQGTTKTLRY
ncbi:hypothetical protein [Chryseolinea lacunae]|uniref:Uncharacterized protein n=1 Tax=Chryseolinea lacunae TaxID=2801331 RepID=A0ABS1KLM4_9BACT|nr:hypothetical protein [Chryseolinea lacunae]MBL0740117.1 hypothetical protein [Chryseolinea lacunae]